jgi:hypothetical protein
LKQAASLRDGERSASFGDQFSKSALLPKFVARLESVVNS